ncbi:MAG: vanadium-dependent haloperoxidase [Verrucomicrobiae bacterium]|nr:vanadium-dependent haloperoxidase [Verrucomicrobiae bacterium]
MIKFPARLAFALFLASVPVQADVVSAWNETLLQAVRTASTNPPRASRIMAMMHLSVYDSVNGIAPTHRPYLNHPPAPVGASKEAAACAAARVVLENVYAENATVLGQIAASYTTTLATVPDGPAKSEGVAWGEARGMAMLALRTGDGSDGIVPYSPNPIPGLWRPTLPGFAPGLLPQWGTMVPFAMARGDMFRPQPPPDLSGAAYALEVNLVKSVGGTTSVMRTADESEIAQFWADGGGTETPPGHWLHLGQDVAEAQGLTMEERARMFALVSLAVADAAIVAWDAKYAYDYWRPITAIREAETDGNDLTEPDPTWVPFVVSPPFPEYTSGHSTFSRSSATVLAAYFGTDSIPFTTRSDALPGVTRSYPGFSAAADEAGISRIFGGIHFPSANIAGQASAYGLGTLVFNRFLTPLNATEFTLARVVPDGFAIEANVSIGTTYRVQASSDLENWELLATISAGSPTISFVDTNAPAGKRYYKLVVVP